MIKFTCFLFFFSWCASLLWEIAPSIIKPTELTQIHRCYQNPFPQPGSKQQWKELKSFVPSLEFVPLFWKLLKYLWQDYWIVSLSPISDVSDKNVAALGMENPKCIYFQINFQQEFSAFLLTAWFKHSSAKIRKIGNLFHITQMRVAFFCQFC